MAHHPSLCLYLHPHASPAGCFALFPKLSDKGFVQVFGGRDACAGGKAERRRHPKTGDSQGATCLPVEAACLK